MDKKEIHLPTTEQDEHGQPRSSFRREHNRKKSFHDLLGILQGITADQVINGDEIRWLDQWLRHAKQNLSRDGDYWDLTETVQDILSDGIVTEAEKKEMLKAAQTVLTYRDNGFANDIEATQRLLGLISGITADNKLNTEEILTLRAWLDTTEPWTDTAAFNDVRRAIAHALNSGELNPNDVGLLDALQAVIGHEVGHSMRLFDDNCPIEHEKNGFCFTGKFDGYTRRECIEIAISRGAISHKIVTRKTRYLVVGALSSRDWVYSSYGRKLEKALEYRKKYGLYIVSQQQWEQAAAE